MVGVSHISGHTFKYLSNEFRFKKQYTYLLFITLVLVHNQSICSPLVKNPLATIPKNVDKAHSIFKRSQQQQAEQTIVANNDRKLLLITNTSGGSSGSKLSVESITRQPMATNTNSKRKPKKLSHSSSKINLTSSFREEIENYPEDEMRLILKQTPNELKELFNVLNTPLDPNMNLTERVAHHSSDNDYNNAEFKEESICRSTIRNIYPREANRADNSLVYVPNNQEFMQVIQAEICQKPDEECNYLQDTLPYGMTSSCQQKYAYKKLLYLDPLEKRMASDLFRYPSCCSCYVRHTSIELRSNSNVSSTLLNPKSAFNQNGTDHSLNNPLTDVAILVSNGLPSPTFKDASGTELIENPVRSNQTDVTESRRHARVLNLTESRRNNTQPPKRLTSGNGDTALMINDSPAPKNFQSNTPTRIAKLTSSSQQTVVLQEDKVYKPES